MAEVGMYKLFSECSELEIPNMRPFHNPTMDHVVLSMHTCATKFRHLILGLLYFFVMGKARNVLLGI